MKCTFFLFCLMMDSHYRFTVGNRYSDAGQDLIANLTKGNEFLPSLRPVTNENETLTVYFGIALYKVLHLDESNQVLTSNVWITEQWVDKFLTWDPLDYNNIQEIVIPFELVWRPDLTLFNNAANDVQYEDLRLYTKLKVRYDGTVLRVYPSVIRSTCPLSIRYFPFDEQKCYLRYGSWLYNGQQLDIQPFTYRNIYGENFTGADYFSYEYNSEWGLLEFSAKREEKYYSRDPGNVYPRISFVIKIERRWELLFIYLLIPNLLINFTAITQFLLPCDSGEKISLSVTIYLSMVVYLLIMLDTLPTAEEVPILVIYILSTMFLVAVSETIGTFVLLIHHGGKHNYKGRLPNWVRVWVLHYLAKLVCMHGAIVPDEVLRDKLMCKVSRLSLIDGHEMEKLLNCSDSDSDKFEPAVNHKGDAIKVAGSKTSRSSYGEDVMAVIDMSHFHKDRSIKSASSRNSQTSNHAKGHWRDKCTAVVTPDQDKQTSQNKLTVVVNPDQDKQTSQNKITVVVNPDQDKQMSQNNNLNFHNGKNYLQPLWSQEQLARQTESNPDHPVEQDDHMSENGSRHTELNKAKQGSRVAHTEQNKSPMQGDKVAQPVQNISPTQGNKKGRISSAASRKSSSSSNTSTNSKLIGQIRKKHRTMNRRLSLGRHTVNFTKYEIGDDNLGYKHNVSRKLFKKRAIKSNDSSSSDHEYSRNTRFNSLASEAANPSIKITIPVITEKGSIAEKNDGASLIPNHSIFSRSSHSLHAPPRHEVQTSVTLVTKENLKNNKEMIEFKLLKYAEAENEHRVLNLAKDEIFVEWQQIAMVIDRFMFWVYLIITVILLIYFSTWIPTHSNQIIAEQRTE